MKAITGSRAAEMLCNITGTLAVLVISGTTAAVWHPNQQLAHSVAEMDYMALVLNLALPAALLVFVASGALKIWGKKFHALSFLVASVVFMGAFACALAMYTGYVAAHPVANLWSRIWWHRLLS